MENINEEMQRRSKVWESMDRSSEESRREAEEYYKDNIMPLVKEKFIRSYSQPDSCEGLILTLGTSYEPLVLSISALKPEKVLILFTEETRKLLDNVIEFTQLRPSQYTFAEIDSENPLKLYQTIKTAYEEWKRPKNIYVDFTGGTKSMAAGCAMAGHAIGAQLIYVAGDYIPTLRKPRPGSEKLYFIDNPYTVFGDLERTQAIYLFNNMDYTSAGIIFQELDQKVPGTREYEALSYLASAYNAWDSLNIKNAKADLQACYDIISREKKLDTRFILAPYEDKIKVQLECLEKLEATHSQTSDKEIVFNNVYYVIGNLYNNALRREKQEKYEMASLLLYRALEMVEQKCLWDHGISTERPDYSKLGSPEALLLQINNIRKKMRGLGLIAELPHTIGLMAGFITLAAIDDEIMKGDKSGDKLKLLENLKKNVDVRNNSIFAHGFEFIDKKRYAEFKNVVEDFINKLFAKDKVNKDELFSAMEFIELK